MGTPSGETKRESNEGEKVYGIKAVSPPNPNQEIRGIKCHDCEMTLARKPIKWGKTTGKRRGMTGGKKRRNAILNRRDVLYAHHQS